MNDNFTLEIVFFQKLINGCLKIFSIILLLNINISAQSSSNGLPGFEIPGGVGVNTHIVTGGTRDHRMIAKAGIRVIRQDFFWYDIEKTKGVYDWAPYDSLVTEMDSLGIRGLFTLNLNNTLYASTTRTAPTDSANIAAYTRFAAAAAERYKSSHCIWEFWNEPNGKNTWKPVENAAQYAKLAIAAAKAILAVDSNATIIAPAMAGIHLGYLDTLFKAGLLNYINGVSVHPYRDGLPPKLPETVDTQIKEIQNLIAEYAPPGKKIYVVSGEWGYSTASISKGVSLQTQADYFVRMQLYNMYLGIPLTVWYDWKNDGTDLTNLGQNRGLVTSNLSVKPSYVAATVLTHELDGYRIINRYNTGNSLDVVLILKNKGDSVKVAAWTQGSPHNITLSLSSLSLPDTAKTIRWINCGADTGSSAINGSSFESELSGKPKFYSVVRPVQVSSVIPVPPIPASINPDEAITNVLLMPTFLWYSSTSYFPVKYHMQISKDSIVNSDGSFISKYVVLDTTLQDTLLHLSLPLDSNTIYYWHVNAGDLGGFSNYSILKYFETGSTISLPLTPELISPAAYTNNVSREPVFRWSTSSFAKRYELQLADDYHVYRRGDSAGAFLMSNIVIDTTISDTEFTLSVPLDSLTKYFWQVRAINRAGISNWANSPLFFFTTGTEITEVANKQNAIPNRYALYQNYPNPFNPTTTIKYSLPKSGFVSMKIYNIVGQIIISLINKEETAGIHQVNFDAKELPSGVYFCSLKFKNSSLTEKILLLK